ncbi:MAG: N-acetyltransferase [Lachnospiraceae bacterium]|nr:N-acetyltransferase [Lachnospiraceae bacterium]
MSEDKITYRVVETHRNMSTRTREALEAFFRHVKGQNDEEAAMQADFCFECFEKIYAVKWFEVMAWCKGRIVGYLMCLRNPEDISKWYVGEIHVALEFKRRGIATKMYDKVIDTLNDYDLAKTLCASVHPGNTASIGLHKKVGFKNSGVPTDFPGLMVDEDETEYRYTLYKSLKIPYADAAQKVIKPLWDRYVEESGDSLHIKKTNAFFREVLEEAERGKNDFRALFYGNEIAGFKFHKDGRLYYYNKFEKDDLC